MVECNQDGSIKSHALLDGYSTAAELALAAEKQKLIGDLGSSGPALSVPRRGASLLSAGMTYKDDVASGIHPVAADETE